MSGERSALLMVRPHIGVCDQNGNALSRAQLESLAKLIQNQIESYSKIAEIEAILKSIGKEP